MTHAKQALELLGGSYLRSERIAALPWVGAAILLVCTAALPRANPLMEGAPVYGTLELLTLALLVAAAALICCAVLEPLQKRGNQRADFSRAGACVAAGGIALCAAFVGWCCASWSRRS